MSNKRRKISGHFVPHLFEMLRSPAWRALSLSARRILDRIEIEWGSHGGKDNGKLPVTFTDFAEYSATGNRHTIAPAIREACALGFIEVTRRGRAGNGEYRTPNLFRLTYLETSRRAATNEWRTIETVEQAEQIAREARKGPRKKIHLPVSENGTGTSVRKHTDTPNLPVSESTPLSRYLTNLEGSSPECGMSDKLCTGPKPATRPIRKPNATRAAVAARRVRKSKR